MGDLPSPLQQLLTALPLGLPTFSVSSSPQLATLSSVFKKEI